MNISQKLARAFATFYIGIVTIVATAIIGIIFAIFKVKKKCN